MKNIHTLLSEIGITVPEEKKADFDKAVLANYKTVAEVEKITTARDNYKTQLETAQTALKEFEGVDVENLKSEIIKLNTNLKDKETEYQTKIADMEFNSVLDGAISKSGARNATAVKALLDLDSLKTSKNQADDITKALESVKSENGYMFGSDEPFQNPVKDTGNPIPAEITKEMFAKMGYSERLNLKKSDPQKYEQLKG
mgnify:CR=1 FL=1